MRKTTREERYKQYKKLGVFSRDGVGGRGEIMVSKLGIFLIGNTGFLWCHSELGAW